MGTPDYFYPTMIANVGCPQQGLGEWWGGGGYTNQWGYQTPHSGVAYAGDGPGAEYMSVGLTDTLIAGKKYSVSVYISLANSSDASIDLIQFAFTDHKVAVYDTATGGPTWICDSLYADAGNASGNFIIDTMNWVLLADTFIATGGEYYMTVGVFDTGTVQCFIIDTINPSCFSYFYFDDFDVHCIDCSTSVAPSPNYFSFTVYPNPSAGNIQLSGNFPSGTKLKIYDILGQELFDYEIPSGDRTVPIMLDLAEGIYIYRIETGGNLLANGKLEIVK